VDGSGGASTGAPAADLEWLKEYKQNEKRSEGAKAPAVLYDEPLLAFRGARDLLVSRELAIAATPAMSSPELNPHAA
jgi:hypothetical protein